jgi:long-chain acyl-CoA synthetase
MKFANLAAVLPVTAARLGPRAALRHRRLGQYRDVRWNEYDEQVRAAACALVEVGVAPGDRVGLVGENSVDWLVADLAILTAGAVAVTPHAPLTARQIHYQLHHADAVWAIASNRAQLDKLLSVRADLPGLRGIVVFDPAASGDGVQSWAAFLRHGRRERPRVEAELQRRCAALGGDDLATIMYTSGTTGTPKGVMLTHGNLVSNALASIEVAPPLPDELVLAWLPLTHIYARTIDHYGNLIAGVTVALADCPETLIENLAEVQPTRLAAVPRFYEKVLAAVSSSDPAETRRRLHKLFGPRFDWASSGGAPLPNPVARAYAEAGVQVFQGYGLTESSPVISFNCKLHHKLGTVGRAIPGVSVRIAPDGEVLTRGPHVMKGYWKEPEATAAAIHDGWLYTGDLGSIDGEGYLSITGRKKELMVLSNGKKVAPSFLEGLLLADPCIDQAMVVGEGRNYLTALVAPNWTNLRKELAGVELPGEPEACAASPAVRELLLRRCEAALAELSSMEQVRKVMVLSRPFSVENEEMTVSLKVRRGVVLEHYAERIEALYRE